jgi:hypothetical protein
MNEQEINELKQKVIQSLDPLMLDESLSATNKFDYFLTIAEVTKEKEALEKALLYANQIEDKTEKANSLLSLLDLLSDIQTSEE